MKLRLDQSGRLGPIVLFGVALFVILIMVLVYILGGRTETVKIESGEGTITSLNSIDESVEIPNEWRTVKNREIDYKISFPKSWGQLKQSEPSTDSFNYAFSEAPDISITQAPDTGKSVSFSGSHSIFNQFEVVDDQVKFCSSFRCRKARTLSTEDVRLFINEFGNEGAEYYVNAGSKLLMVTVIMSNDETYPGLNIILEADESVDFDESRSEQIYTANTEKYTMYEEFRLFQSFIR